MIKLENISHVYFVGAGGIGMSAIARYFNSTQKSVAGYDKTETGLTKKLQQEGIKISFDDTVENLPNWAKEPSEQLLVIYTPAIPKDANVLKHFQNSTFNLIKRSDALALISASKYTIAIAGTHGKTTTTSYAAHILKQEKVNTRAFLGGISSNYNSNYVEEKQDGKEIIVVEADEFDRSFLKLKPNVAIITSCEADHLDIYGNYDNLKQAYNDFANCTVENGTVIIHESLAETFSFRNDLKVLTYGTEKANILIKNIEVKNNHFQFTLAESKSLFINGLGGRHNVLNATAAITAVSQAAELNSVNSSIQSFKGIKRRFEIIHHSATNTHIDDYAHHPTEIKAAISAARELFPNRKLTVAFQPHLFSRTRDFSEDFKRELNSADEVLLMPIYPARELPIQGVTSSLLKNEKTVSIFSHDEIVKEIKNRNPELLLTLGAGNIDLLIDTLKEHFSSLNPIENE